MNMRGYNRIIMQICPERAKRRVDKEYGTFVFMLIIIYNKLNIIKQLIL